MGPRDRPHRALSRAGWVICCVGRGRQYASLAETFGPLPGWMTAQLALLIEERRRLAEALLEFADGMRDRKG